MSKNKSWLENVLITAGLIGGAWLTIEALKAVSKKKLFYSCPICNADIEFNESPCHNCKNILDWGNNG